jgi:hypothetical protein
MRGNERRSVDGILLQVPEKQPLEMGVQVGFRLLDGEKHVGHLSTREPLVQSQLKQGEVEDI